MHGHKMETTTNQPKASMLCAVSAQCLDGKAASLQQAGPCQCSSSAQRFPEKPHPAGAAEQGWQGQRMLRIPSSPELSPGPALWALTAPELSAAALCPRRTELARKQIFLLDVKEKSDLNFISWYPGHRVRVFLLRERAQEGNAGM